MRSGRSRNGAEQVLLLVNVASECGFTPQYAGLEKLYRRHKDAGLPCSGFPCDQFGHQEPGDEAAIAAFCSDNYDVTFPHVREDRGERAGNASPVSPSQERQAGIAGTAAVKWNFTKFLVDRRGEVVQRFAPSTTPGQIEGSIVPLLEGIAPKP